MPGFNRLRPISQIRVLRRVIQKSLMALRGVKARVEVEKVAALAVVSVMETMTRTVTLMTNQRRRARRKIKLPLK